MTDAHRNNSKQNKYFAKILQNKSNSKMGICSQCNGQLPNLLLRYR